MSLMLEPSRKDRSVLRRQRPGWYNAKPRLAKECGGYGPRMLPFSVSLRK